MPFSIIAFCYYVAYFNANSFVKGLFSSDPGRETRAGSPQSQGATARSVLCSDEFGEAVHLDLKAKSGTDKPSSLESLSSAVL